MKPEIKEELIKMKDTRYAKVMRSYLEEKIYEISSSTLQAKTLQELKGSQIAVKTLKDLFSFLNVGKETKKVKNEYL